MEEEALLFEGPAAEVAEYLRDLREGFLGQLGLTEPGDPPGGRPFLCAQPGFGGSVAHYAALREPMLGPAGRMRRKLRRFLNGH